jgi:hypothetical protein
MAWQMTQMNIMQRQATSIRAKVILMVQSNKKKTAKTEVEV